jgi:hypothetical protein
MRDKNGPPGGHLYPVSPGAGNGRAIRDDFSALGAAPEAARRPHPAHLTTNIFLYRHFRRFSQKSGHFKVREVDASGLRDE